MALLWRYHRHCGVHILVSAVCALRASIVQGEAVVRNVKLRMLQNLQWHHLVVIEPFEALLHSAGKKVSSESGSQTHPACIERTVARQAAWQRAMKQATNA